MKAWVLRFKVSDKVQGPEHWELECGASTQTAPKPSAGQNPA